MKKYVASIIIVAVFIFGVLFYSLGKNKVQEIEIYNLPSNTENTIPLTRDALMQLHFFTRLEMDNHFKSYNVDYIIESMAYKSEEFLCVCLHPSTESLMPNGREGASFLFYKLVYRSEIPHTLWTLQAVYFADLPAKITIYDKYTFGIHPLPSERHHPRVTE
jgi:hypothetical protein